MSAVSLSLKTSDGIVKCNQNGGFYIHGKKLGVKSDIEAATTYLKIMQDKKKCSVLDLAKAINRSPKYSWKIIKQLKENNGVLNCQLEENQNEGRKKPKRRTTYGSKTFDEIDIEVLLHLRRQQPNRPKSSHVPIDKFKIDNILRAYEYKACIQGKDPRRIKFGDEKHLKGTEIFNRKNRRDPETGMVENITVSSDFRNTYTIIGFCGIDGKRPFFFDLHKGTNTASTFRAAVDRALRTQFLQPGDILVLDNASIHLYKECKNLDDYLYEYYGILLLFLPARSPELNPIELLWHVLVQRLRHCILPRDGLPSDACALAAKIIMDNFTFEDVAKAYRKTGYLGNDSR